MANSTLWWLIAGGAIVLEMLSGTVYLLLLSAGFAAAAITAHIGASFAVQLVVAAVIGTGAVIGWYLIRRRHPADPPARANRAVNLDIGEQIFISTWHTDGTATVRYRGAQWVAIPRSGAVPEPGQHRVAEIIGNRLIVEKVI